MPERPNSMRHLDDAVRRISNASDKGYIETRTIIANTVVAQMLPDGMVKGGSAMKMRFGDQATRFTIDLDTSTSTASEPYVSKLSALLSEGWEGFTGRVVPTKPAAPKGIPAAYIMQPLDIKLSYNGKPWCTVPLEVGANDEDGAGEPDWVEPVDAAKLLTSLGFPTPGKVPLMPLPRQIAQKLHALTGEEDRVRDLVDLQLIARNADIDLADTKRACTRLFAYRKKQPWPPSISIRGGWRESYAALASALPVAPTAEEAIDWANSLISAIQAATSNENS